MLSKGTPVRKFTKKPAYKGLANGKGIGPRKILAMLILVALALRILFAFHAGLIDDEMIYLRMAQNLNQGNGLVDPTGRITTTFFPLLPIFIAGVARLLQNYIVSGYLVMTIFGSLVLIPVYLLGKHLVSEKIGLRAAALAAVFPVLAYYSSRIYTEAVYTFFLLMAAVYVWQILKQPRLAQAALGGGFLGFAYLANPGAVFYLFLFTFLAMAIAFKKRIWRSMAGPLGLFLLIFMLIAMPYLLFLHAHLGKWTYSGKNAATNISAAADDVGLYSPDWARKYMALTDDGQDVIANRLMNENPDPVSEFIGHPLRTAKIFAQNVNTFYSQRLNNVFPVWLFALAGLGLFAQAWDRKALARNAYILLMMAPVIFILSIDFRSRFFVPFVALSLLWLAQGWQKLEQWSRETASLILGSRANKDVKLRILPWLVGAAVLLPLLPFVAVKSFSGNYPLGVKEAGERIKREAGPGKRIMAAGAMNPYFYAEGIAVEMPFADYDQTTRFARMKSVDYLVMRTSKVGPDSYGSEALMAILGDESGHPDWKLVETVRPGTPQEALVFELKK